MKTKTHNTEEAWLEERMGKVGGSRLGSLFSKRDKKPLTSFYEIIAERIAIPEDGENVMDRGHRLESIALSRFMEETGKKVNTSLITWHRDDNEDIYVSPDGFIGDMEAVEVKCLKSAKHIEAYLTKEIPKEYEYQVLQYFIVNEKLRKLYFVFYDPRMPKDLFWVQVNREDVKDKIEEYLGLEKEALEQIKRIETELTF